ncbi:hypothetical protein ACJX0J_019949, partial [Zea mays]
QFGLAGKFPKILKQLQPAMGDRGGWVVRFLRIYNLSHGARGGVENRFAYYFPLLVFLFNLFNDTIVINTGLGVTTGPSKSFSTLLLISKKIWQNWFDKFWMNNTQVEIHFRLVAPNLHEFGQDPIVRYDVLMVICGFDFIWSGSSRLVTMWIEIKVWGQVKEIKIF